MQHILVVEDDEMVRSFLVLHLENEGYHVTPVENGGQMFHVLDRESPDLILLDLGLPDGDGLTWAQKIRETSRIPIVVATARQGADDRLMALGLGADDYLTKPFDPRELSLRVRNVLNRSAEAAAAPHVQPIAEPPVPAVDVPPAAPAVPASEPVPELRASDQMRRSRPGDRRTGSQTGDRRRGDDSRDRRATDRKGPVSLVIGVAIAVFIFVAGGGAVWFMTQGDERIPAPTAETSTPQKTGPPVAAPAPAPKTTPAPQPTAPATASSSPLPAEVPEPSAPAVTNAPKAPKAAIEKPRGVAAARYSYAWILKSKCDELPDVPWWRVKSHVDMARFVNRKHDGSWTDYILKWTERLGRLRDIYARKSGIRTGSGVELTGAALKTYIDQTEKRLAVTHCLSREAAEYAARRPSNQ